MCLISKHGWGSRKNILCDQILTDDHDNHTCRSDVLLNTAIDNTIFAYIHRLRQEAGGYICYQGLAFCVWKFFEFCAVNGVVLTDVYVVCIRADRQITAVRDIAEGFIFRRCDLVCFSVFLSFLISFLCPLSCYDIICNLVFHKVHRDHGKLLGCSSLKEKYLVVIRNVHKLAEIFLCSINDLLKSCTSVAHFHNRHSCAVIIHHLIRYFFEYFLRKHCRSGRKIIHSTHVSSYPPRQIHHQGSHQPVPSGTHSDPDRSSNPERQVPLLPAPS